VCQIATKDENSPLVTCERPDAWLCELTLQETATEPASTTAVGAASQRGESASEAVPVAIAVADAVGASQARADSGRTSSVAGRVAAPRRLHARASDQGFLPIEVEHYAMLLDWTGRELRADKRGAIPDHLAPIVERLGLNRSNWVQTVRGFGRLFKQAAGRSSSLVRYAARGAGSRARRPLEPPLCRPLARHRVLNRHLHDAFTRSSRPACALTSLPGAVPTGQDEPFYLSRRVTTPHDGHLEKLGLRPPRRYESGCAGGLVRPTSSWVSESQFMGV
jgi:hypothetical protein